MYDLILVDGRFVTPTGTVKGWLGMEAGAIAALGTGPTPAARDRIDLNGLTVLPGGIDPHVHFRDPGMTYKEDFASGTAAAAAGGVTTVFDMPNTKPAVLTSEVFAAKRAIAERKAVVDFGLIAAADPSNLAAIAGLAAAGAIAFKIFMYERPNPPPHGITDDGVLWKAFSRIGATGRPACVHAESQPLLNLFGAKVEASGEGGIRGYLHSRPAICEAEAVARAALLADDAGAHLHICHLSSGMGAVQVRAAKQRGADITAETGPPQLLLTIEAQAGLDGWLKMSPPVRTAADGAQLWEAVLDGTVDMLATDHAPHTAEEKTRAAFSSIASGIIGVETTLPLMLTQVAAGRLTLAQLNRIRSERAARVFGLYPCKGVIQVGADADLVVVDLERRWTLRGAELHSRSNGTPFEGWEVQGAATMTLVRGRVVYRDGEMVSGPVGKMVERVKQTSG